MYRICHCEARGGIHCVCVVGGDGCPQYLKHASDVCINREASLAVGLNGNLLQRRSNCLRYACDVIPQVRESCARAKGYSAIRHARRHGNT
jgi:hypothetical protein